MDNKNKFKNGVQIVVSLALGIGLFWWVYADQDINQLVESLKEANYFWVTFPLALGLLSHYVRALRWKMLMKPLNANPSLSNVFMAVLVGYFANFILPRAGEVARCGVLKKYEGIAFTELIGTVVAERLFDLIITLSIVISALVLEYDVLLAPVRELLISSGLLSFQNIVVIAIVVVLLVVLLLFAIKKMKGKIGTILAGLKNGLVSFKKMENKPLFLTYSVLIFLLYFGMLYFSFYGFEFTEHLSLSAGLATYVLGSLGIVAPVQGGIGAWHYLTILALGLYDVAEANASVFAFVVHLAQMLMLIGAGALSMVLLPIFNRHKD